MADAILMAPKKKINYLSNKELLKELFKSKLSYCSFKHEKYHHYDMILNAVGEITPDKVMAARRLRWEYLKEQQIVGLVAKGMTSRQAEEFMNDKANKSKKILLKDISKEDLCFRVMTYEHIPEEILAVPKTMTAQLMFKPFKHYAFLRNKWTEVGKSHWIGTMKGGMFSNTHGKMTNQLVRSMMMLVDKYAQKGNFRNYSYIDDMKSQALLQLSQVALQFDESRSNNPFSFFTTVTHHSFVKILKMEKKVRTIRDDLITMEGFNASHSYQMDNENKSSLMDIMNTDAFYSADDALIPEVVVSIDPKTVVTKITNAKIKTNKTAKGKKK